jgi:hypothetical protein
MALNISGKDLSNTRGTLSVPIFNRSANGINKADDIMWKKPAPVLTGGRLSHLTDQQQTIKAL